MEKITKEELIEFEKEISELFLDKKIHVPVHLSGNNEDQLIEIFEDINEKDWVLSTHRNHYHVLLKGMPKEEFKELILSGESMHIYSEKYRILTSAIVGGILPIAVGMALAIKKKRQRRKVWVFIGDMAKETGMFHECHKYAARHELPIKFIIEDNGYSTDTPTQEVWGYQHTKSNIIRYEYERKFPHVGIGAWVSF